MFTSNWLGIIRKVTACVSSFFQYDSELALNTWREKKTNISLLDLTAPENQSSDIDNKLKSTVTALIFP